MDSDHLPGWRRVTGDEQVFEGAGELYSVTGILVAGGKVATLYDAVGAITGRELKVLYCVANTDGILRFAPPLPIAQGLYLDLEASVVDVLVQYRELAQPKA
jgi:hypothetical protein